MGLATISKRFTFHAAHRLPHHDGQCRDLHGHSYALEVAVTGRVKDPDGRPDEGMVVDFGVVKEIYRERIEPRVEHKFLNETLKGLVPASVTQPLPDYEKPEPLTTAENIAAWVYKEYFEALKPNLLGDVRSVRVRVWETPTSYAEVGPAPWRGDHEWANPQ